MIELVGASECRHSRACIDAARRRLPFVKPGGEDASATLPCQRPILARPQGLVPHTSIAASALSAIAGALSCGGGGSDGDGVALRINFASTSTFQLTALLQAFDPLAAGGGGGEAARIVCALTERVEKQPGGVFESGRHVGDREALEAAGGGDDALAALLCARLDTQGAARISEVNPGPRGQAGICVG